ncbi:hypothetical protein, conserved [Eimeria brunetti]|uniref:Pre-mRNA-splicing factor CWC26 n=1 Tax=Eimeria brunetti TaxID=51314 RepID=U6LG38_9EIME|nr:hypothetical protein, conserved [Eimeria brunetti]
MASKADYLKKYLRGPRKPQGTLTGAKGGLRLGDDGELDLLPTSRKGGRPGAPGGRGRKTLFTVLRQAEDGARYLFRDENAEGLRNEELLESDEEEVRVVGEDGQALELSEAEKAKISELIAREEKEEDEDDLQQHRMQAAHLSGLKSPRSARGGTLKGPPEGASEPPSPEPEDSSWKEAFALEAPVRVGAPPHLSAACPYDNRERRGLARDEEPRTDAGRDISPPRRRADTNRDISPPRRKAGADRDISPPRRRADTDRGRDISPPRRGAHKDISPPRKADPASKDLSPPRRRARTDKDRDISPPRMRVGADRDKDISPPRRAHGPPEFSRRAEASRGREGDSSPGINAPGGERSRKGTNPEEDRDLSPLSRSPIRTEGNTGEARQESEEDSRPPTSRVVFRDREGRIISEEEWLALEVLEWGGGLKQKEDREAKQRAEERVAKQPFARYEIDEEADAELRARDRWDDPLARAPSFRKHRQEQQNDAQSNNKTGKPLYAPQHILAKAQRPTCPHDAPPNRFGIKPGYRWDGIVRGNGFEEERLKAINRRKWEAQEAHMNNTADM